MIQGVEGFSYIYYEDLSPNDIVSIIEKLKKGEKPKVSVVGLRWFCFFPTRPQLANPFLIHSPALNTGTRPSLPAQ